MLSLGDELVCSLNHLFGEGGAEEQGLTPVLHSLKDPDDVREESHVEHSVRLIEAEGGDVCEVDVPPLAHVDDAAGSPYDDVNASIEFLRLPVNVGSTVDCQDSKSLVALQPTDLLGDLLRQLTSWRKHNRLSHTDRLTALDDWNSEGDRLSRTCARLTNDV